MKRKTSFVLLLCAVMLLLTSCKGLDISIGSVGKNNTTAQSIAGEIEKNLNAEEKKTDYILYGVDMSMDVEGIGKAQLFYTEKLPQELSYSDITVVTVDTRTGEIDSIQDADFATYGTVPYNYVVNGAPLNLTEWGKDSDDVRTIAENLFYDEDNFVYNYVKISAGIKDEIRQYEITFISFVNDLRYICLVDGMTGKVISKEITEL